MTYERLAMDIRAFIAPSYPEITVRVEPYSADPSRTAIFFIEPKFALIYPAQRFHYLTHLIPADFQEQRLKNTVWFELAPGETPADLVYPDDALIHDITPDVMKLLGASGFFRELDNAFTPQSAGSERAICWGDYRVSKSLLPPLGFEEAEFFDVFHVLMAKGGFCDCEILYNVLESSRTSAEYWKARADGVKPRDPHGGGAA